MRFYLGIHRPNWLPVVKVPTFVQRGPLSDYKKLPRANAPWALDSGGFTELEKHGGWTIGPDAYIAEVRRYRDEIGMMDFAAPQDWMCEPPMLRMTGMTVEEHQRRTTENYLELMDKAPDVNWMPVLQGWTFGDYFRHAEAYYAAGVVLDALPRVGVGTVCRRQNTMMASALMAALAGDGLRLHAFGFKLQGLRSSASSLASADSLAWSRSGRSNPPLPGCPHKNCANCLKYALLWREGAMRAIEDHSPDPQLPLFMGAA